MGATGRAAHAARYLASLGLVEREGDAARALQEVLHDDYIPGGPVCRAVRNIRPAPPGLRCGVRMGNDIQSGPYFCGDPATLIGDACDTGGGTDVLCVCASHEHVMRSLEQT
jgi:hypothetical protein